MAFSDRSFRFTNTLRTLGEISRPPTRFDEVDDDTYIRLNRERMMKQTQINHLAMWHDVKDTLQYSFKAHGLNDKELTDNLRKLYNIARDFTGMQWSSEAIESAAVFILQMFYDSYYLNNVPGVINDHRAKLEEMFGAKSVTNTLINQAYEHAKYIFSLLEQSDLEMLFNPRCNSRDSTTVDQVDQLMEQEWGSDLKLDCQPFLPFNSGDIIVTWDSLIDRKKDLVTSKADKMSFEYKGSQSKKSVSNTNSSTSSCNSQSASLLDWLSTQLTTYVSKYNSPFSVEELLEFIKEIITNSHNKSDDELANELNNFLTDSCIVLIQKLVRNRKTLVKAFTKASEMSREEKRALRETIMHQAMKDSQQPIFAQNVVIQTAEEKKLMKEYHKTNKKILNALQKDKAEEGENSQYTLEDLNRMKVERERALLQAMYGPAFKKLPRENQSREDYPFVFDSYAETKNTSAFVSGTKMTLPIGFNRNDYRKWEEITIPAPAPPPDYILNEFHIVNVKDLDEFGQIGFRGFSHLNRIQSIVYKTAMESDVNMLICAPTGAGKTNVAMLAILKCLKNHSNGADDIHRNEFKIVYVAPMKALAAEMTENFKKRLEPLQIKVRELTGDMQMTTNEIKETQILVTTPEKWDVVTRKAKGDMQLLDLVRLLIIDEVHLLQSDRGAVLEALVARTARYVESSQSTIRVVGLSATLPNYKDVAEFLSVDGRTGLFVFDNRFRPVPLSQTFIGCKATQAMQQLHDMDEVTYDKVFEMVSKNHQVMVFVHARNSTLRIANYLKETANKNGQSEYFSPDLEKMFDTQKEMRRARNKVLPELFESGFAIHHAGILRHDRNLVEKLFRNGVLKVLVCTSTLAWGVNLPAHAVIIRGTEMYDSSHGSYVDISMLDVMQIFGRAGRPQYDSEGHGTIITSHDKLRYYLSMLTNQYPIESTFQKSLTDNMNAEIVSGTITTIEEAMEWLRYTYYYIRMHKNPLGYGLTPDRVNHDPTLLQFRQELVANAANELDRAKMVRYNTETGFLDPTDWGRTASHFYIKYDTVEKFNDALKDGTEQMDVSHLLGMIAKAQEFDQLKTRDDEIEELDSLMRDRSVCRVPVRGGMEALNGKVNILMQAYLSRAMIKTFSLASDMMFIKQNVPRICRGLFEYVIKRGWATLTSILLKLSRMFENQQWGVETETPLRQFEKELTFEVMEKLERAKLPIEKIIDESMTSDEIGRIVRHQKYGKIIKQLAETLPYVIIEPTIKPITRTVLMVKAEIKPYFYWNDRYHGNNCETFWIWVVDPQSDHIYHSETFKLTKKQVKNEETQTLLFNIPLLNDSDVPPQYIVHASSDRWVGCDYEYAIPCSNLILPEKYLPYTKLLNLDPLPVSALQNPLFESVYNQKFKYFNPIQTQIFHTLYHTDKNVLLGAPTGSGKTIAAEIALFRLFTAYPERKTVYIAPLKALVRERVDEWKKKIEPIVGKTVVELTGDVSPDMKAILNSDVIVTTPEKWDGISRSWQTRPYVKKVGLIVIDEIHMLGEDRGPILEVVVARTNFINQCTGQNIRLIGLSTAVANAQDLADWLQIRKIGLYNFKPSVRPVPIQVHVQGYPGKNYCPRMALMNKPTFRAIKEHSPDKPVLVFVSSRRQTRLTAFDLINLLAENPNEWLHMDEKDMEALCATVRDENLCRTLPYGIGLHHAGLHEKDRSLVEELFTNRKIQVLITTATLAWGVNLPAHAVVIKGTEYFDGKQHRYIDFPITDVLQMAGRAGRPQFDDQGVAVVLVHDIKKEYYKKFLYEPFPVESSLLDVLPDHLNAEIVAGTISTKQDCMEYLTLTYLFRRIAKNPSYYGLEAQDQAEINTFLSRVLNGAIEELVHSWCVTVEEDERTLHATYLGRIASYYYLHHTSVRMFEEKLLRPALEIANVLQILCDAHEYNELPVRHNEDRLNVELSSKCLIAVERCTYDSPHTKANLLLQAHFSRLYLPCADYLTDLKSVLDQAIRIMQAMIDITATGGYLGTTITIIKFQQMVIQGRWQNENSLLTLPSVSNQLLNAFEGLQSLRDALHHAHTHGLNSLKAKLQKHLDTNLVSDICDAIGKLPLVDARLEIWESGSEESSAVVERTPKVAITKHSPVYVKPNTEYIITVRLFKRTIHNRGRDSVKAIAPKFPKQKDENWILILSNKQKDELIALKRSGAIGYKQANQRLIFKTPAEIDNNLIYTLMVMSDSYIGLDREFEVCCCPEK